MGTAKVFGCAAFFPGDGLKAESSEVATCLVTAGWNQAWQQKCQGRSQGRAQWDGGMEGCMDGLRNG